MSEKPDWEAIRKEYESGVHSYQSLAQKYGVAKTTLIRRSQKWTGPDRTDKNGPDRNTIPDGNIRALRLMPSPSPANAVEGANLGLEDLLALMQKNKGQMGYDDHVKASNAMERYNKIIINAPPDEDQEEDQEDLSGFTEEEARTYAELQERAKRRA